MSYPYELGVLFVHGIGQQKQGETLISFGEPLQSCIQNRLKQLSSDANKGKIEVELRRATCGDKSESAPAHVEMLIRNIGDFRHEEAGKPDALWLFAEAWWAESFPTPTYREIANWGLNALPWTLIAHFDRRLRRACYCLRQSVALPEQVRNFGNCTIQFLQMILAGLLVVPILAILILVMLIVGYLPIPWVRDAINVIQHLLAATVGDSYIFTNRPIARAAIISRVRAAHDWLSARCERILVIAHSQGAAIAHDMVRRDSLIECDRLITFGSGLQKLSEIRDLADQEQGKRWLQVASTGLIAGGICGFCGYLPLMPDGIARLILFGFLPVGLIIAAVAYRRWQTVSGRFADLESQCRQDRKLSQAKFRLPDPRRVQWLDCYASADPVPNGALLDALVPNGGMKQQEFHNRHSVLSDHTTYWQNRDEFIPVLSKELLSLAGIALPLRRKSRARGGVLSVELLSRAGIPLEEKNEWQEMLDKVPQDINEKWKVDDDRQQVATMRRIWRVSWLRMARFSILVAALLILLAWWSDCPAYIHGLLDRWRSLFTRIPLLDISMDDHEQRGFGSLTGVCLLVTLALVWYLGLRLLWWWWDDYEMNLRFQNSNYRLDEPRGILFYTVVLSAPLSAAALVLESWYGLAGLLWLLTIPVCLLLLARACGRRRFTKVWWQALAAIGSTDGVLKAKHVGHMRRLRNGMQRKCGRAALALGKFRDGRRPLGAERAFKLAIKWGEQRAYLELGWLLEQKKDLIGAMKAYKDGMDHGSPFCAWLLGKLQLKLKCEEDAIKTFSDGMDGVEEFSASECAFSLGCMYLAPRRRDLKEAQAKFSFGMERNHALSAHGLGRALRLEAESKQLDSKKSADEKKALLLKAENALRRAVFLGDKSAAIELGELKWDRGDIDGAKQAFEDGVKLRDAQAALYLGFLLEEENQLEPARVAYQRAIQLAPLVDVDISLKAYPWAAEKLSEQFRAEAENRLASVLDKLGCTKAALRTLERAMQSAPTGEIKPDLSGQQAECEDFRAAYWQRRKIIVNELLDIVKR